MVALALVQGHEQQLDLALVQRKNTGLERCAPTRAQPAERGQDLADAIGRVQAERHILQPRHRLRPQAAARLQDTAQLGELGRVLGVMLQPLQEILAAHLLMLLRIDLIGEHLQQAPLALVARPVGRVRLAQRAQQIGPRRVVNVQQITKPPPEVVVLAARRPTQQPRIALEIGPARAPAAAIEVVEFDRLLGEEARKPDVGASAQCGIGLQLRPQPPPVLLHQLAQAAQHLLAGLALQVDVATRRQQAEALVHRLDQLRARQPGELRQQAVEAEFLAVPADEIEDQAALLALGQTQSAADLLLEQHRALRRAQQEQRIDQRQVDALVEQVAGHQRGDLAPRQHFGRTPALVRGRITHHAQRPDASLVQPRRHVLRVRHRDAEHQRAPTRRVARQPPPLVEHQPRAHVVAGDQPVDRRHLPCLLPRHGGKVGLVVAGVILEGAQQLLVERVPEPKLDRRRAIRPVVEVAQDRLAVAALRRRGQAEQHARAHGAHECIEAIRRQAMALVDHHGVPVIGTAARHQLAHGHAVDGGEQMLEAFGLHAADQDLAKGVVAQHLAIGAQRLLEDLLAVRHEQQPRPPTRLLAQPLVVEGRHHRLAGAGGGDHQVAPAAVIALDLQLVEHLLLIGLGLEVEVGRAGVQLIPRLASERLAQCLAMCWVGGVVGLELAVFPKRLEVRAGTLEEIALAALGELHRPFQPAHQGRARQVGAAHVGGTEAGAATEQPGLGVQPGAPPVQRHADVATRQAREFVQRADLGGTGVSGGQHPQPRARLAIRPDRGDRLQDVEQLAHAGMGDEAHQDVHLIAGRQLAAQLGQQRGRALARGEEPGEGQAGFRNGRLGRALVDGLEYLWRSGKRLGIVRALPEALLKAHQEEVDEVELLAELLRAIAVQVVEDAGELGGERVREALGGIFDGEGLEAVGVLVRRAHDVVAQGVGEELVVEAVRQCHVRAENPCPRRFGRRRSAPSEVPKRRERQAMILDICIRAVQRGAVLFEPLRCTTLRHGPRQAGLGCLFVRNRDVGRGVLIDDAGGVHRAYAKIVIHAERYLSTSNAAVPSGRCAGKPTTTDSCRHGYCAGLLARSDEVARAIRDHLPHIKQTPRHR